MKTMTNEKQCKVARRRVMMCAGSVIFTLELTVPCETTEQDRQDERDDKRTTDVETPGG